MFRSVFAASFLVVSLVASTSLAWHDVGHMLTVLVAYKQLSPGDTPSPAVKRLVAILKQHPRYQEDFAAAMPKGLSETDEARWLLCRAAVWPDQIRNDRDNPPTFPPQPDKQGSYGRGIWHYIDTPLLIVPEGTSAERVKAREEKARQGQDLATDVPSDESQVKNALQAIAFNRQRFARGKPEEQAVAPLLAAARDRRYPSAVARDGRLFARGARSGRQPARRRGRQRHSAGKAEPARPMGRRARRQPRSDLRSQRALRPALRPGLFQGLEAGRRAAGRCRPQRARQAGRPGQGPSAMGSRELQAG